MPPAGDDEQQLAASRGSRQNPAHESAKPRDITSKAAVIKSKNWRNQDGS